MRHILKKSTLIDTRNFHNGYKYIGGSSMHGLKEMLIQEQKHMEDIIRKAKLEAEKYPEGYLRISTDRGHVRYYHCINDRYGNYPNEQNTESYLADF